MCSFLGVTSWVASAGSAVAGELNNPIFNLSLYVDPDSSATQQIDEWGDAYPKKRKLLKKIANHPQAQWFGDWNKDVEQEVAELMSVAQAAEQTPTVVIYNIPHRDCDSYSAGGTTNGKEYKKFIRQLTAGLGGVTAIVILEPDSLGVLDCLSNQQRENRFFLLEYAVYYLTQHSQAVVYIDAGHPHWVKAKTLAKRLKKSGIAQADGFALNVSHFYSIKKNREYGQRVSEKTNTSHFIIDTSRNGQGAPPDGEWCNPPGMGLGHKPTTDTRKKLVDAYLWIKPPGESDGECDGGPSAGMWWLEYALDLARFASW